ncbi:hypothetical protein ABT168_10650 [Streptomyces sp. NPDC001793]|uniref:hypothetical protein n=1 Tax=Streptomyces sp. NPDC001793 TaxID=3154657 RepID=UPI003326F2C6
MRRASLAFIVAATANGDRLAAHPVQGLRESVGEPVVAADHHVLGALSEGRAQWES